MARICKLLGEGVPVDLVFPTAEVTEAYKVVLDIRPPSAAAELEVLTETPPPPPPPPPKQTLARGGVSKGRAAAADVRSCKDARDDRQKPVLFVLLERLHGQRELAPDDYHFFLSLHSVAVLIVAFFVESRRSGPRDRRHTWTPRVRDLCALRGGRRVGRKVEPALVSKAGDLGGGEEESVFCAGGEVETAGREGGLCIDVIWVELACFFWCLHRQRGQCRSI
ncbi:hypothetical protein DFH11DRAFT_1742731 [Phellopilus nigrolimitatus]|nr:hypothetical protein DFH11DRAFT_1742731 [Phellopilus nigrolimitatus]